MHIYFLGIGGVAIGPLARLARDAGYSVSGSDIIASRYTESVKDDGIPIQIGSSAETIAAINSQRPVDWVVYSAAVPISSAELQFARDHGIRTSKRDVFINHILKDKDLSLIAVSGTHGKTNTTGMVIWLCKQLDIPISYSIGTNISFGKNGVYQSGSKYFVYEADEFDENFLKFEPEYTLIPSVDYDHAETYPTVDIYKKAFSDFISQSNHTFTWRSVLEYLEVESNESINVSEEDSDLSHIKLPGQHTRRNAELAIKLVEAAFGAKRSKLIKAINEFPGTERRLEKITENLYSDYAHHPVEIRATLQAAKELNPRVVVVYQPHQNARQIEIKSQYNDCFADAEKVLWLPTYLSREKADNIISPDELIRSLDDPTIAQKADMDDDLYGQISNFRSQGVMVLLMAAGDLDAWVRDKFVAS